jgi:hypothetical protein
LPGVDRGENLRIVRNYASAAPSALRRGAVRSMSLLGYKQTFSGPNSMSALPPGTDIPRPTLDFRL